MDKSIQAKASEAPIDILLVEDNEDDILFTLAAFDESHIKNNIQVTRNGQEALDYIYGKAPFSDRSKFPMPQLLLLDINMPKKGGFEVLKTLRDDQDLYFMRIIMLTTSKDEEDVARSYESGACAYISKPLSFDEFKKAIEKLNLFWHTVILPKN